MAKPKIAVPTKARKARPATDKVVESVPGNRFSFAGEQVAPGSHLHVELPVSLLPSGAWMSLPVAVVHGKLPGPTVFLTGAVHGDELNGVEIVRSVLEMVQPEELRGTLLAVPIVNVFGVLEGSRYLPDRRDLNRSFPGSAKGSLASRLAHLLVTEIIGRCSFGIDFHSGSGGRKNLSQLRINLQHGGEIRRLADAFQAPLLVHAKTRPGSLRHAAELREIPYLLFEGGEAHRLDDPTIEAGVSGALRVLKALNMIESAPEGEDSTVCVGSSWARARHGGIFRPKIDLGDRVKKTQVIATVTDAINLRRRDIRASQDGVVIGLLQKPLVHSGDALIHLGTMADPS